MRRIHLVIPCLVVGLTLAACATNRSSGERSGAETSAAAEPPAKGVAPPSGHPLAKIEKGMPPTQVRSLLGDPTGEQTYMTGKSWIPYYFGSDTHRTDWKYKGKGRVVFSHNRWSGTMKVLRIDYDPSEDGY